MIIFDATRFCRHPFVIFNLHLLYPVEASKLKDEDSLGKSDPYVELWLEKGYKQKTTTKKNDLNPKWNESFTFNVHDHSHLYLKVLDSDTLSKDDEVKSRFQFVGPFQSLHNTPCLIKSFFRLVKRKLISMKFF